jgi:hypothetical protein
LCTIILCLCLTNFMLLNYTFLLMYRLMMAPWAETCSDIVRPINSIMRSEMWVSWLVCCCAWQEKQNSYIVLTYNRMHSLNFLENYDNLHLIHSEPVTVKHTPKYTRSGFLSPELWSYSKDMFTDEFFFPPAVTDRSFQDNKIL